MTQQAQGKREGRAHTYEVIGAGVDHTGWFKIWLRRDDGKEVKVSKKRVANLRREGRVTTASETFGDLRSLPATCKVKNERDEFKCDHCEALWTKTLNDTGYRPSNCLGRAALTGGRS